MQIRSWTYACAVAVLSSGAAAATLTNSNIDVRTTEHRLSFSDLAFSGVSDFASTLLQFHGAIGDSGTFGVDGFAPGQTISVTPGSGIAITGLTPANASGVVFYTATIVGTTNLTITQSWTNLPGLPGQGFTLTPNVANGLNTLEFRSGNSGFLRVGGLFDFLVTMPGNWSVPGIGTGQSQLLGVNSQFAISNNFTFNATTNRTTFEAVSSSYPAGNPGVNLSFVLHGSPVPENGTALTLLGGLALLSILPRRSGYAGRRKT
jgi:hypothetical protein